LIINKIYHGKTKLKSCQRQRFWKGRFSSRLYEQNFFSVSW